MHYLRTTSFIAHTATRFARDENGTTAVEYGIIAAGIFLAITGAVVTLGESVKAYFQSVADMAATW
jgi:pilus assembly protein Flp/PilA